MRGKVFEIKRFAVHDGDGIRTTVFLKGCPLHCVWCHNPEGISADSQLAFDQERCTGCGECQKVCPSHAHEMGNGGHILNRDLCTACGACAKVCYEKALRFYGREMSVEEVVEKVLEDREFFENSDGGVTLSGGECLMQADFCTLFLKKMKECGIHTAVDTCGMVSQKTLEQVMPYTDVFLYDVKAFREKVHMECTGCSNQLVLKNLKYLDECGKKIEVRIPFVPNWNDGEIEEIGEFLKDLKNLTGVRVLPYHNYSGNKYRSLGMEDRLPKDLPTAEMIKMTEEILRKKGLVIRT